MSDPVVYLDVNVQIDDNTLTVDAPTEIIGATSYTELTDKPKINSVELSGNKSASDLGLLSGSKMSANTINGIINNIYN